LVIWHDRRAIWGIIPVGLLFGLLLATGRGLQFLEAASSSGELALVGRVEAWQRAIYMIQDFPFTGIGIGTFDPVADALYPLFLVSPDLDVAHAHNNLLEVGVDLGIPGLVAYVALLTAFGVAAWRAASRASPDSAHRALVMGLACGMLAHQVFGLTDAFILGTKLGIVMWVYLAFIAVLGGLPIK
jgi:putative inorganic carbon (HCO3(-)) transporter